MNPAQSPANKHLKTVSTANKKRNTPKRPKLKRPEISEKSLCCVEANKKIEQLEKSIEKLKREIKLLQHESNVVKNSQRTLKLLCLKTIQLVKQNR